MANEQIKSILLKMMEKHSSLSKEEQTMIIESDKEWNKINAQNALKWMKRFGKISAKITADIKVNPDLFLVNCFGWLEICEWIEILILKRAVYYSLQIKKNNKIGLIGDVSLEMYQLWQKKSIKDYYDLTEEELFSLTFYRHQNSHAILSNYRLFLDFNDKFTKVSLKGNYQNFKSKLIPKDKLVKDLNEKINKHIYILGYVLLILKDEINGFDYFTGYRDLVKKHK